MPVSSIRFSPEGNVFAALCDNSVYFYRSVSAQLLGTKFSFFFFSIIIPDIMFAGKFVYPALVIPSSLSWIALEV
jgi:hypothetical protein